jgi:hypothetical protein
MARQPGKHESRKRKHAFAAGVSGVLLPTESANAWSPANTYCHPRNCIRVCPTSRTPLRRRPSEGYNPGMKSTTNAPLIERLVSPLGECLTPESARRLLALKPTPIGRRGSMRGRRAAPKAGSHRKSRRNTADTFHPRSQTPVWERFLAKLCFV